MSYERRGMGTNGKVSSELPPERPRMPTGTVTREQIDAFVREHGAYEEAVEQQREAEYQAERAEWTDWIRQRGEYCEANPEACAAAFVPLCAVLELPWGAIIGAIASPKGERWGGAKWGALAAAATCPTRIATVRLGWFGGLLNWGVAIAAPIMAARYRLKRKRERGEVVGV
jgi:hypothetical protein